LRWSFRRLAPAASFSEQPEPFESIKECIRFQCPHCRWKLVDIAKYQTLPTHPTHQFHCLPRREKLYLARARGPSGGRTISLATGHPCGRSCVLHESKSSRTFSDTPVDPNNTAFYPSVIPAFVQLCNPVHTIIYSVYTGPLLNFASDRCTFCHT
jgi:hypothetical protein